MATAYQKEELEVEIFPASPEFIGRNVVDIISHRAPLSLPPTSFMTSSKNISSPREEQRSGQGVPAKAMVYLSHSYVKPGCPWDEYIERMELGMSEASPLGISTSYLLNDVCPWLKHGTSLRVGCTGTSPPSSQPEVGETERAKTQRRAVEIDFQHQGTACSDLGF